MDRRVQLALDRDRTIDVTTTGRRSGLVRRFETWFYRSGGRYFLSGSPGKRDWQANIMANPRLVFHLKESVEADLEAVGVLIRDVDERRAVISGFDRFAEGARADELEAWVSESPLIEIKFVLMNCV